MAPKDNATGLATPLQRRGCRQPTPIDLTPEGKPNHGEAESAKKVSSKRTQQPEDTTGQAKKAKVEHAASPLSLVFASGFHLQTESPDPPQKRQCLEGSPESDTSAGDNSTEPPQIDNAEQPGDNSPLQNTPAVGATAASTVASSCTISHRQIGG